MDVGLLCWAVSEKARDVRHAASKPALLESMWSARALRAWKARVPPAGRELDAHGARPQSCSKQAIRGASEVPGSAFSNMNNTAWTALGIVRVSKQTHEPRCLPVCTCVCVCGGGGGKRWGRAGSLHVCYVYILYITCIIHPRIATRSSGFSNEPSLVSDYPRPTLPPSHILVSPQ